LSASDPVGVALPPLEVGAACFLAASTLADTDGKSTGGASGTGKIFVELRFVGALIFLLRMKWVALVTKHQNI
jgi:hypothetical protein